jgi:transposase-like protein
MEFPVNAGGKRVFPSEFKKKVLDELRAGQTAHELARKYGIQVHNILYWKKGEQMAVMGQSGPHPAEATVPVSEYKKALEEIKNLRRSLVNMTVDRDILKEAVDLAAKKKWILPVKSSDGTNSK